MNTTNSFPTTSDISAFMRELGYEWSNQAQVYFNWDYDNLKRRQAEKLYKKLIGEKPFNKDLLTNKN